MTLPSEFDNTFFPIGRAFINQSIIDFINTYLHPEDLICDIGNQGKNVPELSGRPRKLVTLDITADTSPDIVADITRTNAHIRENYFDALLCTEVLEHVVEPFAAVRELARIVKVGGYILITTPLNCRIHGPVPDCWRFTEFGLKVLLRDFEIVSFRRLDTPDRNLFPLEYSVIVKKVNDMLRESDPREMRFQRVQ